MAKHFIFIGVEENIMGGYNLDRYQRGMSYPVHVSCISAGLKEQIVFTNDAVAKDFETRYLQEHPELRERCVVSSRPDPDLTGSMW
ncbi:MAG: hypothetical protein UU77_C0001G0035 [candidate division WWE3 bacterium GW2011_GWC1_41_7]|uniref:Uncharacterized protein n=3 Tax=Katanobacteria TaxID=422282 RepID=A0A0G0XDN7_UNCKA|nr:MAG: hypothetical protein UU77_C0001G0035 [candidate division WWE3 bacterium GW2011_GWC1_41_7]KKS22502.1 MAG: hypothetical protein UU80_C0006G0028 [candidate division WWE3 bacterium GW2011_GWA1_41_8]OGC56904.1 MAG: hypothetical protein A2976_00610 [candidate division WWE3 bacterium RIFCSPLOWO2_01_FULL_41_9]